MTWVTIHRSEVPPGEVWAFREGEVYIQTDRAVEYQICAETHQGRKLTVFQSGMSNRGQPAYEPGAGLKAGSCLTVRVRREDLPDVGELDVHIPVSEKPIGDTGVVSGTVRSSKRVGGGDPKGRPDMREVYEHEEPEPPGMSQLEEWWSRHD